MVLAPPGALPYLYDIAINGVPYMVSWEVDRELLSPWKTAYLVTENDLLLERSDISSNEMTENKLDLLYWQSQRSWDYGAGQQRLDVNLPNYPAQRAFQSSLGVDVFSVIGQATLLPATTQLSSLSTGTMAATDNYVYAALPGPNLLRFSDPAGSDIATIPSGASTFMALDLATDGQTVWGAVQAEGVTQTTGGSTIKTQINSFDSIAGFTQVGGSPTIVTTGQTEGTGFLAFTYQTGSNPLVYTYSVPTDFSAYKQFNLIFGATTNGTTNNPVDTCTIRLKQDASNYFQYTFPLPPTYAWYGETWTPQQMTTVGSPSMTLIKTIEWLCLNPTVNSYFTLDDFKAYSGGTSTIYSNQFDCRVIAWAKDSLYGAGLVQGSLTQWQFFSIGAGSTGVVKYILPDGFQVTCISELAGFIYFSAIKAGRSQIYAWDGTNSPFVAVVMPPGEAAWRLIPFLGAGMLIGGLRFGSGGVTSGLGVLYRAFPQSNGTLTIELIQAFGADDGHDYTIKGGTAYLDKAYFAINNPLATVTGQGLVGYSGLGCYFPTTGGWSTHIGVADSLSTGNVIDAVVFKGKLFFSVTGSGSAAGLWAQAAKNVATGTLTSSLVDWNIDKTKMILQGELGSLPLNTGTSLALQISYDGGATFSAVTSMQGLAFGASPPAGYIAPTYSEAPIRVSSPTAVMRAVLTTDTTHQATQAFTPILKKDGLGAIYGVKPRRIYKIAVKAYEYMSLKNGVMHPNQGPGLPALIESQLTTLRDSQQIVQFQPSGYGEEHTTVVNVRIASMNVYRQFVKGSGFGNVVQVTMFEVPA